MISNKIKIKIKIKYQKNRILIYQIYLNNNSKKFNNHHKAYISSKLNMKLKLIIDQQLINHILFLNHNNKK